MKTPEYNAWVNMRARCTNPNHPEYHRYGGRGITFSKEWNTFSTFINDIGVKPDPTFSLERIDVNGNYSKENCRWASKTAQSFNQRISIDNSSGITGVYFERYTMKWKAYISIQHRKITIGRYEDFFDACCARKSFENKLYANIQ